MEVFGDASRSTALSGGFSPMQTPGCRFTWSPRLLLLELFASVKFRLWLLPLPLLFLSSCAGLVSSETVASLMLTVALAQVSERTFSFGRSFCSVSGSAPSSLVASWCGCLGACLPFVPCLFLWSRCHSRVNEQGAGEVLPIGLFSSFSFWGCPASALAVADKGGRVLRAHPFFGTIVWCLFKSLLFPSYATRCRYDVPGVLASGSGLAARVCSYAWEGTLESPLVLVLVYHSSLFLVGGSSDGSAPGDRFLSPGRMCSFTQFRLRSVASALSLLGRGLFFLL